MTYTVLVLFSCIFFYFLHFSEHFFSIILYDPDFYLLGRALMIPIGPDNRGFTVFFLYKNFDIDIAQGHTWHTFFNHAIYIFGHSVSDVNLFTNTIISNKTEIFVYRLFKNFKFKFKAKIVPILKFFEKFN